MCEACGPSGPRTRRRRHQRAEPEHADLVITGGPIVTMDGTSSHPEAVAIRDGRFVAVGSAQEVATHTSPGTERLDLDGRTLLPGLIDPQMHAAMVLMSSWVDLSPMMTPTADAVAEAIRSAEPNSTGWVLACQFDPTTTAGEPSLDRPMLDRLSPDRPVLVIESNGHIGHVNSAAFDAAGLDRDTRDPPAGRYRRGPDGELDGRLEETPAMAAFATGIPFPTREESLRMHRDLLWNAASKGVTMLHDCGIGAVGGAGDVEVLESVIDADSPLRYRGMLVSDHYDTWVEMGLRPGSGNDLLRIDGIKAWSDGSNQAGTGYQREPYLGTSERGTLNHTPEELSAIVRRAHGDGWQVGVHANGDAAIDVTIDAFEAALRKSPRPDHRHRIEHCSILHPDQIARMAEFGLSPSFLIGHICWWGRAFRDRLLGADRSLFYDPCVSAVAAGPRISLHSDWRVTSLEPLRYVEDAVTRFMAEGGEVLNADERIPVDAALRAVTIDAAWQCRADDITGSITVGKCADVALLEDDPYRVDPERIASIAISATRLGGEARFGGAPDR